MGMIEAYKEVGAISMFMPKLNVTEWPASTEVVKTS